MSDWTKIPQEFLNILHRPTIVNTGSRLYWHDQATDKDKYVTNKAQLPAALQNALTIYYYRAGECNVGYVYKDPDDEFIDIYYATSWNSSISTLLAHQKGGLFCSSTWYGFRIMTKHSYKIVSLRLDLTTNLIWLCQGNALANEIECVNAPVAYGSVPWSTQDLRWGSCTCCNTTHSGSMDPQHNYIHDLHADSLAILKEICNAPGYSRYKASTSGDEDHLYSYIQMAETEPYKASNAPRFKKPEFNSIHKLATKPDDFLVEINNNCVDIKHHAVYYHINLADSKMWATATKQSNNIDFLAWKEPNLPRDQAMDVFDALIKASPNQELTNIIATYKDPNASTYHCFQKIRHALEMFNDKKLDALTKKYIPQYAAIEQNAWGSQKLPIRTLIESDIYQLANDVQKRIIHQIITTQERPDIPLFVRNLMFLLHPTHYGSNIYGLRTNNELFIRVAQIATTRTDELEEDAHFYTPDCNSQFYNRKYNPWKQIWQYFHLDFDTTNIPEYMNALKYICQYAKSADEIRLLGLFCFIATDQQHAKNIEQLLGGPIFRLEDPIVNIHEELYAKFDNYRIWINEPYLKNPVQFEGQRIEKRYNGYYSLKFTTKQTGSSITVDTSVNRDEYYQFANIIIRHYINFWANNHSVNLQPIIK